MKHVIHENAKYQIEITRQRVVVTEYEDTPVTSGITAGFLSEVNNRTPVQRTWYETSRETQERVVLACGWKFSTAKAWRDEWDYLYRREGGKASGYGDCRVRVVK